MARGGPALTRFGGDSYNPAIFQLEPSATATPKGAACLIVRTPSPSKAAARAPGRPCAPNSSGEAW
jgi:hypothetical protein